MQMIERRNRVGWARCAKLGPRLAQHIDRFVAHGERQNVVVVSLGFVEVEKAYKDFEKIRFEHVPRERNKDADRLANVGVDEMLESRRHR